ncbi:MAG: hypothetical protein ACLSVD_05885 [Eggerthellaceae bacterium]
MGSDARGRVPLGRVRRGLRRARRAGRGVDRADSRALRGLGHGALPFAAAVVLAAAGAAFGLLAKGRLPGAVAPCSPSPACSPAWPQPAMRSMPRAFCREATA